MPEESLRNQFLIAMPSLADSNFERSVSLLCEHGEDGALGLVINRPTDLSVGAMLEHLEIDFSGLTTAQSERPVYWGGPVQAERGFVLHSPLGDWESSIQVSPELALSTSRDILNAIGQGQGPDRFLITLGYAGWESGQLERELMENSWLNIEANPSIIFDTASDLRWDAATRLLGIDPASLSHGAGHA